MIIILSIMAGMSLFALVWLGYWMSEKLFIHTWHVWWDDHHLFGLRCEVCQRWTLGCRLHWLCGCCDNCAMIDDSDDAA